jgi:hypothetical protein
VESGLQINSQVARLLHQPRLRGRYQRGGETLRADHDTYGGDVAQANIQIWNNSWLMPVTNQRQDRPSPFKVGS